MSKLKRHLKIRELIQANDIDTQDELVNRLKNLGFNVTQATVSRDIKELHLVKVPSQSGKYKYSTPTEQRFNPQHKLKRLIMEAFVSIDHAHHFIVLKPFHEMRILSVFLLMILTGRKSLVLYVGMILA